MVTIDLKFLQDFTKGDAEKMKKYINMFLTLAPQSIADMEKYHAADNLDALKVTAHSLKPQISYMGIKELEHTIKDLEYIAGSRMNTNLLGEKISFFKEGCERAYTLLKNELQKL